MNEKQSKTGLPLFSYCGPWIRFLTSPSAKATFTSNCFYRSRCQTGEQLANIWEKVQGRTQKFVEGDRENNFLQISRDSRGKDIFSCRSIFLALYQGTLLLKMTFKVCLRGSVRIGAPYVRHLTGLHCKLPKHQLRLLEHCKYPVSSTFFPAQNFWNSDNFVINIMLV